MGQDKLWVDIGGRPLLALTVAAAADAACFDAVVIAAPEERWDSARTLLSDAGFAEIETLAGGDRRQDTVRLALQRCGAHDHVCVHDAARPLVSAQLFRDVVAAAETHDAATAGVPIVDTVKRVAGDHVVETLPRGELIATQTPQAFATFLLTRAHEIAHEEDAEGDDDAYLVERMGQRVAVVAGDPRNFKVTQAHDLVVLRALLAAGA